MPQQIVVLATVSPMRRCRSCGADIRWYETPAGKKMPINADATPIAEANGPGGTTWAFDSKHTHWATCPHAKDWKQR